MIALLKIGAWVTLATWFALHAHGGWRNWNGYGPLAEGCHFRAIDPNKVVWGSPIELKPLRRTNDVLCWHYAQELAR